MRKISINNEIFTRAVETVVTREELARILKGGRPLRIKHGIDATSPELHLGHAASLWKIRALQEVGHKAVILLGDITTKIGDPTGREKARPILPPATIQQNIRSLESQIRRILINDKRTLEVRKSSEWYSRMKAPDFIDLLSSITYARLIQRGMFQQRIKKGQEIFMHELIYPVLQGYDSVMLKSDLTIIGSDQLFNEHLGRFFQEKMGQRPQVIVGLKILPGLGGEEKMSKSLGNYIGIPDPPQDKFGKVMRVLDSLIVPYLESYTGVSPARIQEIKKGLASGKNPMEAKLFLAEAVVERYHGKEVARKERERFLKVFSRREIPEVATLLELRHGTWDPVKLLYEAGLARSKAEARRLLEQGALEVDERRILSREDGVKITGGSFIKVGKRRFAKVK